MHPVWLLVFTLCTSSASEVLKAPRRLPTHRAPPEILRQLYSSQRCKFRGFLECEDSGQCLPEVWFCDGEDDCPSGMDESRCFHIGFSTNVSYVCGPGQFSCGTGSCIQAIQRCDKRANCENAKDELQCENLGIGCRPGYLPCGDGGCYSVVQQCDKVPNCANSKDELDCAPYCPYGLFMCPDGRCVHHVHLCNNFLFPGGPTCPANHFRCSGGQCIPNILVCNNIEDCGNGDDEISCPVPFADYMCPDGRTFQFPVRCNGFVNCADGSDEENCHFYASPVLPGQREGIICDEGIFLEGDKVCDDFVDCLDGKDEDINTCAPSGVTRGCRPGQFLCKRGLCLNMSLQCNGAADCPDGDDEQGCSIKSKEEQKECIRKCLETGTPIDSCTPPPEVVLATTQLLAEPVAIETTPAPPLPPTKMLVCPSHTMPLDVKCVTVHDKPTLDWSNAMLFCNSRGATLLEIEYGNVFTAAVEYIKNNNLEKNSYWVGANDINAEGRWFWSVSRFPVHWGAPMAALTFNGTHYIQEPSGGREENCAAIDDCPFPYLMDQKCSISKSFMCQYTKILV